MDLTTDRTNLIEIKNKNISKNVLLKSSSIIFKNKLLEQKKYHTLNNININNNNINNIENRDEIPKKIGFKQQKQTSPIKMINSQIMGIL